MLRGNRRSHVTAALMIYDRLISSDTSQEAFSAWNATLEPGADMKLVPALCRDSRMLNKNPIKREARFEAAGVPANSAHKACH
ncbi:hypothetical protein NDU88_007979 [Pleurodeles waltl]|uniref:Uncharacterized protein n=1 Tax=Pleurodeles waltl TaxID=8319 RepID=A0AAV7NYX9_PLEWA|nr:hypothetical protein NDU88_007979 [Pleurodeles waltl]